MAPSSHLVLHVEKEIYNIETEFKNLTRAIWCPYMPDGEGDAGDMDPAKMLVLLYGTQVGVFPYHWPWPLKISILVQGLSG